MQNAVQAFESIVPKNALGILINNPKAALDFAQRIDNLQITQNSLNALSSITVTQWEAIISKATSNTEIRRIADAMNNSGRMNMTEDEKSTTQSIVVDILVQLGMWGGAIIAVGVVIFGLIGAIAGFIAAAGTAAVVAAVASLIVAILAVIALIGLIITIIVYYLPNDIVLSLGTPMYGGSGGENFADDVSGVARIKRIRVRHDPIIYSIQTDWVKENGEEVAGTIHGGGWSGGREELIELNDDEYITHATGRCGIYIDKITFYSNQGRTFGPYGGSGGDSEFKLEPKYGKKILGFQGRADCAIDAIGIRSEIYGSGHGGTGGVPFLEFSNDAPKIYRITLWGGAYVDAIKVDRKNTLGQIIEGEKYGGSGGNKMVFLELADGEKITKITGRAGSYINKLRIETDGGSERAIECGEDGGTPFEISLNGKKISGFWGRADKYLDAIGICGLI